jgi:hypothetical protein
VTVLRLDTKSAGRTYMHTGRLMDTPCVWTIEFSDVDDNGPRGPDLTPKDIPRNLGEILYC